MRDKVLKPIASHFVDLHTEKKTPKLPSLNFNSVSQNTDFLGEK